MRYVIDTGCCSGHHSGLHVNSTIASRIVILMRFKMSKTIVEKNHINSTKAHSHCNLTQPGHPLFDASASKAKLPEVGKSDFTTVLVN